MYAIRSYYAESMNLSMAGSRKRRIKDRLASVGVTGGGVLVLVALLLIFFYLLYVIKPIFDGASLESQATLEVPVNGHAAILVITSYSIHYTKLYEYKRLYPNVNIQIQAAGSSTAPPALTEGTSQS